MYKKPDKKWDNFVNRNSPLIFHTRIWQRVLSKGFKNGQSLYYTLEDNSGEIVLALPGVLLNFRLFNVFYPYTNGEKADILRSFAVRELFDKKNKLKLNVLISGYKDYVKRRGFKVFMEKDEKGNYKTIKESALIYSFETYIQAFLQVVGGKSYREADTGLGKSDLIINVNTEEYLIETKIYYFEKQFNDGKKQLAYYCKSLGLRKGVYLVFYPNTITHHSSIKQGIENIENIEISIFLIEYDETKW